MTDGPGFDRAELEPHDLPRLRTTLLLVAADNDRSISPDVARQVRDIVATAVIERLPGLGHLAHEEQPQGIADLITRYAAQTVDRGETTPVL